MDISTYIQALITTGGVIMGVWGFLKVVRDIKKTNDDEHDRQQRIDRAVKTIEDKEKTWDEGLADVYRERNEIVKRYDKRLDEQDDRMTEQESKNQQLLAMMCMCLRAQDAILEALVEKEIGNGEIKAMHKELKDFIMEQVQQ